MLSPIVSSDLQKISKSIPICGSNTSFGSNRVRKERPRTTSVIILLCLSYLKVIPINRTYHIMVEKAEKLSDNPNNIVIFVKSF
jgi:hypothetical protein